MKNRLAELTAEQMAYVDREMVENYGIDLTRMMECAGLHLAQLTCCRFLQRQPAGKVVTVLAGRGGNGGGALVAARRLYGWGSSVRLILSKPEGDFKEVPGRQLQILARLGVRPQDELQDSTDVIIDGLIGYNLKGDPKGTAAELIRWANQRIAPVVSMDVPSGFDASEGRARQPVIEADATLTLALPKKGLLEAKHQKWVGELYLADIGVPAQLYAGPPLNLALEPPFRGRQILRLNGGDPE